MDLNESLQLLKAELARLGGEHPWALFMAIVILPGFGFPASVLLLLAGAVWPTNLWLSSLIALTAVTLNILWTHSVSVGPAAVWVRRLIPVRFHQWLSVRAENRWEVACILRLTPGIPLCVQNYALGLSGVPLRHSLGVGLPVQAVYVSGFVLTGGALFSGKTGLARVGLLLLVLGVVVVRLIGKMWRSR